jgi:superfamily II DNA or RNA helicase
MQLYYYQSASVAAIMAGLQLFGRALLHLATGLGKTVVMREVVKEYAGKRVLFLVHDIDILEQNMERFAELFVKFGEVGIYHGADKSGFDSRIVFATFQTMFKDKELFGRNAFDLILVDEAHHAPAETFRMVIDYFDGHKLGVSATIERLDELKVEDIFGEPVISIELEEAVAKGYLTPFTYKVMSDSLNADVLEKLLEEAETARQLSIEDINKTLFINKRDEQIVAHIKEEVGNRKTLVFCRNIDHANRVVKLLGARAVTTHSRLKGDAAKEPLKLFRQGRVQYLVVVNKVNEGVDIPDAEVVVFLRATESKIVFLQQLGRTLRKSEGKEMALVLDFVGSLE